MKKLAFPTLFEEYMKGVTGVSDDHEEIFEKPYSYRLRFTWVIYSSLVRFIDMLGPGGRNEKILKEIQKRKS